MSRDIFYLAPSESDGGSEQQAASNERVDVEEQPANANASSIDLDSNTEEAMSQSIKKRVYYAAKDGLSLSLHSLLSDEKNEAIRNAYINQVCLLRLFDVIEKSVSHIRSIEEFNNKECSIYDEWTNKNCCQFVVAKHPKEMFDM